MVAVCPFSSEWGNLYTFHRQVFGFAFYSDRSKAILVECFRKEFLDIFRRCRGCYIPVLWRLTEQKISNTTTHDIGIVFIFIKFF